MTQPLLLSGLVASLTSALLVVFVYLFLYRIFRAKPILVWTIAWAVFALRFLLDLVQEVSNTAQPLLSAGSLLAVIVCGVLQVWGTYLFFERSVPRGWFIAGIGTAAWVAVLLPLGASGLLLNLPAFIFIGVTRIWIGWVILRAGHLERNSRRMTGWAFILLGVHALDYSFFRPLDWAAPLGFFLGTLLGLGAMLGLLMVFFNLVLDQQLKGEAIIRQGEESLRRLFDAMPVMLYAFDDQGQIVAWNQECERVTGYSAAEVIRQPGILEKLYPDPQEHQRIQEAIYIKRQNYHNLERTLTTKDGRQRIVEWSNISFTHPVPGWSSWAIGVDMTERHQAQTRAETILRTMMDGFWMLDMHGRILEVNQAACALLGYSPDELQALTIPEIEAVESGEQVEKYLEQMRRNGSGRFETRLRSKDGRILDIEIHFLYLPAFEDRMMVFFRDITARKEAERNLQKRIAELEAVSRVSAALRSPGQLENQARKLLEEVLAVIRAESGGLLIYSTQSGIFEWGVGAGWSDEVPLSALSAEEGLLASVLQFGQAYTSPDISRDPAISADLRQLVPAGWCGIAVPLRAFSEPVGVLLAFSSTAELVSSWNVRLLETLAEIISSAVHQLRMQERTERNLGRLAALHEIDSAITANLDLRLTLETLLNHAAAQLGVHAGEVLMFNSLAQRLDGFASHGFRSYRPEHRQVRPGEGPAGRALLERRQVDVQLVSGSGRSNTDALYQAEGFQSGFAVPLISKGVILGVLAVLHREKLRVDSDWLDFFKTLAGQAALAIEDLNQLQKLRRSSSELGLTLVGALEGWARSVEWHCGQPEGRTQRLVEQTVRMAEQLGIAPAERVHIRSGAYLHDIGLLKIPQAILRQSDGLAPAETALLQSHPQLAYELLAPVAGLQPALDIPYCHHEHWDGSGYPRQLKGEEIPLAARIFAVVEAWDQLQAGLAGQPLAEAGAALHRFNEQAGRALDPQVVKAYIAMMNLSK